MSDAPPRAVLPRPNAVLRKAGALAPALLAGALLMTGCGGGGRPASAGASPAGGATELPQATTYTTLDDLPRDTSAPTAGNGTVVHPSAATPISAKPGAPAVAELPSTQLKGPTWVPVVESRPGWRRVLLPSRPNGVTGWIPETGLQTARSSQVVKVDLGDRRLALYKAGRKVGTWTVAVGAPKTPTPTGRTFMLASLAPANPTYSPLILPVGAHSATLDTFGGGPGTVAFHGWPTASVFGRAVTHGCVRVPADALKRLAKVPLGSSVLITD
ncbi:L,D-transpeptidase [Actinomadura bangladeshensis]|uniref:L,D-transpeptidase n=1 Tax=Actinomadura bangladeshensis TaxID=453573 RepID=UPI0030B848F4